MSELAIERQVFLGALKQQLGIASSDGSVVALALVDIRHFHRINWFHGFAGGDAVLDRVSRALQEVTRKKPFVRRVGNDEFGMIFSGIADTGILALMGGRIAREIGAGFLFGDREINFAVDVGLAAFPQAADSADELYFRAEAALRMARDSGEPCVIDKPQRDAAYAESWQLEFEAQAALSNNELELYYQPCIKLQSGEPARPEALLRWASRNAGQISPAQFVPLIEQGGRSLDLARWVLNSALKHCRQWGETGVAINLSAAALGFPETAEMVVSALRLWGVPAAHLCIEISESSLIRDHAVVARQMKPLREAGVSIALDDFGSGHSSLIKLRHLPINQLKMDPLLVTNILRGEADRAVCEHVIALAHRLGVAVVAKGVEDQPTLNLLQRLGCDMAQGFRIARPMIEGELRQWLRNAAGSRN